MRPSDAMNLGHFHNVQKCLYIYIYIIYDVWYNFQSVACISEPQIKSAIF